MVSTCWNGLFLDVFVDDHEFGPAVFVEKGVGSDGPVGGSVLSGLPREELLHTWKFSYMGNVLVGVNPDD